MGFAVLARDFAGDIGGVAVEQFLEFEHNPGTLERRRVAPGNLGRLGAGDGFVDFGGGRKRQLGDLFTGCRIEDRRSAGAGADAPGAGDRVFDDLHHQASQNGTIILFSIV